MNTPVYIVCQPTMFAMGVIGLFWIVQLLTTLIMCGLVVTCVVCRVWKCRVDANENKNRTMRKTVHILTVANLVSIGILFCLVPLQVLGETTGEGGVNSWTILLVVKEWFVMSLVSIIPISIGLVLLQVYKEPRLQ